jgi:hypothetical protein
VNAAAAPCAHVCVREPVRKELRAWPLSRYVSQHVETSEDDWKEIAQLIREATKRNRGYAGYFDWPNRDQKELGVAVELFESLEATEGLHYRQARARGANNDPPDLEVRDAADRLIGIEVTELVDPDAIKRYKAGNRWDWAEWSGPKFAQYLQDRVSAKDSPSEVKGGPYSEYWLLIHTDEPALSIAEVQKHMTGIAPFPVKLITQAFLLLSYHPNNGHPYVRLPLGRAD